jgi:UDP-N-acetylmuramate: L-alanyl-gamma-D-glutamyl-meso-diaminopimelate ligase
MGALAGLLRSLGHEVTGSDVAFDPPIGPELAGWGVTCMPGFDPSHLEPAPDLVVVGNVARRDNPEAKAALERGLEVTTMAHALARFALAGTSPLVVAGTHGKTTTSAMCAWLLESAGLAPGFFIGGLPKNFDQGFRAAEPRPRRLALAETGARASGTGDGAIARRAPFVVEGDEYDTAFFEKTPKFWHYQPEVGIVTSIEHDHIDIYPTEQSYLDAFEGFIARLPQSGLLVAAADSKHVVDLVTRRCRAETSFYALLGDDTHGVTPEWMAAPGAVIDGRQEFDLYVGGVFLGRGRIRTPGVHNVRNAVAAIAATAKGYGVPVEEALGALYRFGGVRRRQELVAEVRHVKIYDDFAHHPTAVEETLRALRNKHPAGRLWAVFEPRSATACRSLHQEAYARAFGAADRVLIAPLGRTNIPEEERLDVTRLVRELRTRVPVAEAPSSVEEIVERIAQGAEAGDTIALLSNGAFGGIHKKLGDALGHPHASSQGQKS